LKKYAERIAADSFFENHEVFNAQDLKRMGDLRYALTIIITLMSGYFNRDDGFGDLLERYNDDFGLEAEVDARLRRVFAFIEECNFSPKSRAWRKADLLTLVVELDPLLSSGFDLQPSIAVERLETFYAQIDDRGRDMWVRLRSITRPHCKPQMTESIGRGAA
jgi:hypothetical protein